MAKKSNKTEHVLKLITRNDDGDQEDFFRLPQENDSGEGSDSGTSDHITLGKPLKGSPALKEIKPYKGAPPIQEKKVGIVASAFEAGAKSDGHRTAERTESTILQKQGKLINIAEILVGEKIELVMDRMKMCSCPACVNDVFALALNSLPSKYVTANTDKQYFQLEAYKKQYETDILAALAKACVRVKASPRHVKG